MNRVLIVATCLDTIPGCVAVGLFDLASRRVVAAYAKVDHDFERASDAYRELGTDHVGMLHGVLVGNVAPARQLVIKTERHFHLYDRVGRLTFVAVCSASHEGASVGAMLAAFRISCRALEDAA